LQEEEISIPRRKTEIEREEEETIVDLYGIHVTQISTNRKGRKYFSGRRKDVACATDGEDSRFSEDAIKV
jgi:hypothetical protein